MAELKDFILAAAKDDKLVEELQNQEITSEQQQEIDNTEILRDKVIAILKTVKDPEIPVNIWDLGLIYKLETDENNNDINIDMTLTTAGCPVAGAMPVEVQKRISNLVPEIGEINVKLVWEPKWNKEMMTEEARLFLDLW